MKKIFFVVLVLLPVAVFGFTGTTIGPEVSKLDGRKLQWEAGSYDYFVMFKSLIANNFRTLCSTVSEEESLGCDWDNNPEGDTCLQSSTFELKSNHIPEDAYVEAAYLVWSGSVDPDVAALPVSNTATLTFNSKGGDVYVSETVAALRKGSLGTDTNPGQQDFSFEGMGYEDGGTIVGGNYTYRVDVTDIFKQIHDLGREAGHTSDGVSLIGYYTVGDVVCSDDPAYISQIKGYGTYSSSVIGGWSIIFVYRSVHLDPKMVCIYNGFSSYQFQEQDIPISGFEFPEKPEVKVTVHSLEGDPGISFATEVQCGEGFTAGPCPPEGLSVTGETTGYTDFVILQNDCNPPKYQDTNGTAFNYSETYNSISSMWGFESLFPECIGGNPSNPDPDALEYTMDVDTFVMNAASDTVFDDQFKKGDKNMFFRLGANGDYVYTNFMVVSVDTQASKFDIPVNDDTPTGRENIYCGCSTQPDAVCFDYPFYYAVKIQNWGDDISTNVTIRDNISSKVSYVSGTTRMCKEWESANVCSKWKKIEDGSGGSFPLAQPYKIADSLAACNKDTSECPETIMVRFKVKPSDVLHENDIIENTAFISDNSGKVYRTNTAIPLRLVSGSCPSVSECENPDLADCGGDTGGDIEDDSDVDDTGNTGDDSDLGNTGNNSDTEDAEHDSDMEDTENTGDDSDVDDIGDTGDTADDSDLGNTGDIGNTAEKPLSKSSGCSVLLF